MMKQIVLAAALVGVAASASADTWTLYTAKSTKHQQNRPQVEESFSNAFDRYDGWQTGRERCENAAVHWVLKNSKPWYHIITKVDNDKEYTRLAIDLTNAQNQHWVRYATCIKG